MAAMGATQPSLVIESPAALSDRSTKKLHVDFALNSSLCVAMDRTVLIDLANSLTTLAGITMEDQSPMLVSRITDLDELADIANTLAATVDHLHNITACVAILRTLVISSADPAQ